MTGPLSRLRTASAGCARKFNTEFLGLWFVLKHPRTARYARLIVLIPMAYLLSLFDLVPNALSLPGIGQFDDILVARYSYLLLQRIVGADILKECRERSASHLANDTKGRYRIVLALGAAWILIVAFLGWDIYKRLQRKDLM